MVNRNPRVRQYMKRNRRTVINNTNVLNVRSGLIQQLYKVMDRNKATECHINVMYQNYMEVDLFDKDGNCVRCTVPVYSKED
jgi:hypothetical protein